MVFRCGIFVDADIRTVARVAGHRNQATTELYAHDSYKEVPKIGVNFY